MANMKKLTRDYGEIIWTGKKCIMGMPISFTRYILTDSKLITRVGLLNLKEDEIELYRVYDKSMKLPFGQRIVGCGTITLLSKDSDTPTKVLQSVKHPRDVKRLLRLRDTGAARQVQRPRQGHDGSLRAHGGQGRRRYPRPA